MTREIKFRAWHPEWGEMVESSSSNAWNYDKREFYPFCFEVGFSHYPHSDGWVLMEYTGMKDMNGREIYEGDIMNHLGLYGPNFVVDYDRGIFHLIYPGLPEHNNFYADLHKMLIHHAVIGNIYENPELIKVQP